MRKGIAQHRACCVGYLLGVLATCASFSTLIASDKADRPHEIPSCLANHAKRLASDSPAHQLAALSRIFEQHQLGRKALPLIVRLAIRSPSEKVRSEALFTLGAAGLDVPISPQKLARDEIVPALLVVDDTETRRRALAVLRKLGPAGRFAGPTLVSLIHQDGEPLAELIGALGSVGGSPAAGAELMRFLEGNHDARVRAAAIRTLGQIGVYRAAPKVALYLASDVPAVRLAAAEALGHMGPLPHEVVARLAAAVTDERAAVRVAAVKAIGRARPRSEAAARVVATALRDDARAVRQAGVWASGHLDSGHSDVVHALLEMAAGVDGETATERRAAERALLDTGAEALTPLREALHGTRDGLRQMAANVLGRISPKGARSVASAAASDNLSVSRAAILGMADESPYSYMFVDALPGAILRPATRHAALLKAEELRPVMHAPTIRAAIKVMDDASANTDLRIRAVKLLATIGVGSAEAQGALRRASKEGGQVGETAKKLLRHIGNGNGY